MNLPLSVSDRSKKKIYRSSTRPQQNANSLYNDQYIPQLYHYNHLINTIPLQASRTELQQKPSQKSILHTQRFRIVPNTDRSTNFYTKPR